MTWEEFEKQLDELERYWLTTLKVDEFKHSNGEVSDADLYYALGSYEAVCAISNLASCVDGISEGDKQ